MIEFKQIIGRGTRLYDGKDYFTINLFWTVYNLLILGAALGVAAESRQVRRTHRVVTSLPATLYLGNGQVLKAECIDFSMTGVGLQLASDVQLAVGDRVQVGLMMADMEHTFPARVMLGKNGGVAGLELDEMDRDRSPLDCNTAALWVAMSFFITLSLRDR